MVSKGISRALVAAAVLLLSFGVHAQPSPQVARGMQWLTSQVQANGSLLNESSSIATSFQNGTESSQTLKFFGAVPSSLTDAIASESDTSTEYLARKIVALAQAGRDVSSSLTLLAQHANPDGGFGGDMGFGSEPLDTARTLIAFKSANTTVPVLPALNYLLSAQAVDGSYWAPDRADNYTTAIAVLALRQYAGQFDLLAPLQRAVNYLVAQQSPTQQWGDSVFLTAAVYEAVHDFLPLEPTATAVRTYLIARQGTDGSWAGDPFSTAIALRALMLADTAPVNPTLVVVKGKIVDRQTGLALDGVQAVLIGPMNPAPVTTSGGGLFEFRNLTAGTYTLQFSLSQYATLAGTTTIQSGQAADLGVIALTRNSNVTVGTVRGTVKDATTGAPLTGVVVSLGGGQSATTDSSGNYQISSVTSGNIVAIASKSGYASATGGGSLSADGTLIFSPGLFLAIPSEATAIEGVVTDRISKAPLVGVLIAVTGATQVGAITDAQGRYHIEPLNPGAITVNATRTGYGTVTATATAVVSTTIQFSPVLSGATVESAKLFLSSVVGGQPANEVYRYSVAGAADTAVLDLTLTHPSINNPFGIAFSKSGEMFVTSQPSPAGGAGSVARFLNPQGSPSFNNTITSSSFNSPHSEAFRSGELFIANPDANNVLRFIFDSVGNATQNGVVTAGLTGTRNRGVAVHPLTGELFVTECCELNKIHRYIFDASGNAIPNGEITGGGLSNPHAMAFSARGELFVASAGSNSVSRFLFDAAGNATTNGQLDGNGLNGPLALDFSPWGELFVANVFGTGGVSRWVFDSEFHAIQNGFFSTPNTIGELKFAPPIPDVRGVVVDASSGKPLAGVAVEARIGNVVRIFTTAYDGYFEFGGLPAGQAQLNFMSSGYLNQSLDFESLPLANLDVGKVRLQKAAGLLQGTITNAVTNAPLAGATITVTGAAQATATTDAQGNYRIQPISSSGEIAVTAALAGYDSVTATITVAQNPIVVFSRALSPMNTVPPVTGTTGIKGVVLDAGTSQPLGGVSIQANFGGTLQNLVTTPSGGFQIIGLTGTQGSLAFALPGYVAETISAGVQPLVVLDLGQVRLRKVDATALLPDLVVSSVDSSRVTNNPQTLAVSGTLSVTVRNQGAAAANSGVQVLAFYDIDGDRVYRQGIDIPLAATTLNSVLAAGAEQTVSFTVNGVSQFHDAPIYAWVDSAQQLTELNKNNNFASAACRAQSPRQNAGVDLTAALLRVMDPGTSQGMNLSVRVGYTAPPPVDPISWWMGESNTNDNIGSNPGIWEGTTAYRIGKIGQAFQLDGASQIRVPIAPSLRVSNGAFTAAAWVQPDALTGGVSIAMGDMSIFDTITGGVNVNGWRLIKQSDNRFWFCFGAGNNHCGDPAYTVFSTTRAQVGLFYHVVGVKTATDFAIYVNGKLEDVRALPSAIVDTQTSDLLIGGNAIEGAHWIGSIDDAKIYDRALFADEIQALYNGKAAPDISTDVTFYDGDPAAGGVLLGTAAVNPLAANTYKEVIFNTAVMPSGTKDIYAVVNKNFPISECNPNNNVISTPSVPSILGRIAASTDQSVYGANKPMAVQTQIVNAGSVPAAFSVELRVEDAQGTTVLGFTPKILDALNGGAATTVLNNWDTGTAPAGTYRARAILRDTNGGGLLAESAATFTIALSSFQVMPTTDKPSYSANEIVQISSTVKNLNSSSAAGVVRVSIKDTNNALVAVLGTSSPQSIAAGASGVFTGLNFQTGTIYAGQYQVLVELVDSTGYALAIGTAPFAIIAGSDAGIRASSTTDKQSYSPADTVQVNNRITNTQANAPLNDLRITVTVKNPDGTVRFTKLETLIQLPVGGFKDYGYSVPLNFAPAGQYSTAIVVTTADGVLLAQASTQFTVSSSADNGTGLTGSLTLSSAQPPQGDTLVFNATFNNGGNATFAGVPTKISIVNPATQQVIAELPNTLTLAQGGQSVWATGWNSSGAIGKTYVAVLSAVIGGNTITLAQQNFTITEPPVKLDVTQAMQRQSRVLVLLSCHPGWYNEGSYKENERKHPCFADRTTYIDNLLTQNNATHLITTDIASFTKAFRSGRYNSYWLLGAVEKFDNDLSEEVREAVFRGDTLFVDSNLHDHRNFSLFDAIGVKYRGKLSFDSQNMTLTGSLYSPASVPTLGQPLKIELLTGIVQATYDSQRCNKVEDDEDDDEKAKDPKDKDVDPTNYSVSYPAIISNTYGSGRALLFDFDSIKTMQASTNPAWTGIIQSSLTYLTPDIQSLYTPGARVAVTTTIRNLAQTVDVSVAMTLPAGATFIEASPTATLTNGNPGFAFNLPAAQSKDVNVSFTAPATSGSPALQTTVSTTRNGVTKKYGDYSIPFTVNGSDTMASKTIADLQTLPISDSSDQNARDQAVKRLQSATSLYSAGRYLEAIDEFTEAIQSLLKIKSVEIGTYRLQVDRLLQEAEIKWAAQ